MNLEEVNKKTSASTTLSHYRIVSRIGAGGMGEVWLAEDTRLERKVALKLLPAVFTQDAERVRRFMQEAKAASALNHPNIITVYDIGESEAGRFIVMELVAGRTLRSVIAEDNTIETLLALGSQMAKALSAAHAAGITHRDIKPDNIMVREDGYVKVLDFGLARLLPTASSEDAATLAQQTTPGMIMGTVAYMSPEQACGQSASPPSDIFALGIVLYELATGQHPFSAETLVGYLHAITLQTPPPPSQLRPGIPAALDALILRMLKKDVSQRPTAGEVAQALQEMERHGDTPKPRYGEGETVLLPTGHAGVARADEGFWVAVLPFKWRGADAALEALAEGLTEDIVTGLSRFSYLRVIARSSTLRYVSESSDARAVGKALSARYVMEGSLRQAGSMLRVAVQLVDATTGAHLWAETYERPYSPEQIFALQDDLVPRIVSTVADAYGILPHSMSQAVRNKAADQLTPYEALLRSFSYVERVTAAEHAEAKAALGRAVQQAPGDSDCWAMLSILFTDEHIHGFSSKADLLGEALQLARRAVDANPLNHRAYQALAWALCYRKEFDACRHAAERTVALNPMDASAMAYVGQTIAYGGGWERGCELLNRAMQLNPHHPGWYRYAPFLNAYRQADYRGALDIALKMNMPGVSLMYVALAAVYGQLGEIEAARQAIRELLALRPDFKAAVRTELEKLWDSELVDRLIDGLRKAGLDAADEKGEAESLAARYASGETRADEGFWVAVLPFKYRGANANL
jgi:TolB-like protein